MQLQVEDGPALAAGWRQNVYVFTGKVVTKWEIYYLVGINRDLTTLSTPGVDLWYT